MRFVILLVWLATTVPASTHAQDWPQFRGPTGQGIAPGSLPLTWGKGSNITWTRPIPGRGWSSPVISGGRLYLTTAIPATEGSHQIQSLRAICLEAQTGKLLWNSEVFRKVAATLPPIHSKNSYASPTPVVEGERLFVHFGPEGTACLDLQGKVIWKNTSLRYEALHGGGGSPILAGRLLVFSCDGTDKRFVVALDSATGKVVWKTDRSGDPPRGFSFCTPLLINAAGRSQIISPASDMVGSYDQGTGQEIWRVRYDGYSVVPRPVYGNGLVYISTGFNTPHLLAIRPDGHGDVTDTHVAWTQRRSVSLTPSFVLQGSLLFMISDQGVASCLDAKTGQAYWQERLGGNFSSSPIMASDGVYFLSEDGTTTVVKAGKNFELLARNSLGEETLASCGAGDGALFLRTEGHLYRIANGK